MHGQPEGRRELPVEMIFREGCDAAQRVQVQIVVQMPVYVIQHPLHPGMVALKRRFHRSILRSSPSYAHADMTRTTDLAVLSVIAERSQGPCTSTPKLWMNGEMGGLQTGGFHIVPNSDSSSMSRYD